MNDPAPKLFCFGLGFSARALAASLLKDGWRVAGTARDPAKRADLAAMGIMVHAFDENTPLPEGALAGTTHILVSIPPLESGDPVLALHGKDLAVLSGLAWVGYLSTTGVYGDHGGEWVDEDTVRAPTSGRAKRRMEAEDGWLALWRESGVPVHLFRLAGIYGPGRSAIDTVLAGRAKRVVKPGQVFSRIHVEDIAAVLRASMDKPDPGAVYNVCDDEAAPPQDVILHACELLGVEPPPEEPFQTADLSAMARSFYADNKRVSNRRIKEELGVSLRYPDYRAGLAAILTARGSGG